MKRLHICDFAYFKRSKWSCMSHSILREIILKEYCIVTFSNTIAKGMDNLVCGFGTTISSYHHGAVYDFKLSSNGKYKLFFMIGEGYELDENGELILNFLNWFESYEVSPIYQQFVANVVGISSAADAFIIMSNIPKKEYVSSIFPNKMIFNLFDSKFSDQSYPINFDPSRPYDFCFFGTPTEHRRYILNKLKTRFKIFDVTYDVKGGVLAEDDLKHIISQSRFVLNIPQHERWSYTSEGRVASGVMMGGIWAVSVSNIKNPFPYTTTFSLSELLNLDIDAISKSCFSQYESSKGKIFFAADKLDLMHFIKWLS